MTTEEPDPLDTPPMPGESVSLELDLEGPSPRRRRKYLLFAALTGLIPLALLASAAVGFFLGSAEDQSTVDSAEPLEPTSTTASRTETTAIATATTGGQTASTETVETSTTATSTPPETTILPVSARILASSIEASSTASSGFDAGGREISYRAENVQDGLDATAWRTPGNGVGERILLLFERSIHLTELGLIPGYSKIDGADGTDRFLQNRRVASVRYTFSDGASIVHEFTDSRHLQLTQVNVVTTEVTIEVLSTTVHGGRDFTAISEVQVNGYAAEPGNVSDADTDDVATVSVFPLSPVEVVAYSPGGHAYPATDLFAPTGTLFVAVTAGVVDEVSHIDQWDSATDDPALRGGRYVSIIGDDGLRYYGSHLASVADGLEAGDRVEVGEIIGTVGQSGNAAGTTPHLHFGISNPTFPGDWEIRRGTIDPISFLNSRRPA